MVHLGSSVGFGIGPLGFGVLVDRFSYGVAWAVVTGLFIVATACTGIWRGQISRGRRLPHRRPGPPREGTTRGAPPPDVKIDPAVLAEVLVKRVNDVLPASVRLGTSGSTVTASSR